MKRLKKTKFEIKRVGNINYAFVKGQRICRVTKAKSRRQMPVDEINFIQGYMELNLGTEIPDDFAFWCAVAGVSCALGRNVYLDMGTYTIYPNFYIVLVASSGRQRKSTAIGIVERLIRKIEPMPTLIAQKITPEALIESLKKIDMSDPRFMLREISTGFCICDEMANFLNKQTYEGGLGALLIPLYDCKDSFEYRTKGGGSQKITDACLGLLGGSTVDWIRSGIPEDAVGGGLTSRIIFVYVDKPQPPVPLTAFSAEKKHLFEALVRCLQRISQMKGEFKVTPDALEFYDTKYRHFYHTSELYDNPMLSGYASRRWFHIWKLCMVFSVCGGDDMVITREHFVAADQFLTKLEMHLPMVLNLITSSEKGNDLTFVFQAIKKKGAVGISRTDLMRACQHKVKGQEINEHLKMLIESGRIVGTVSGTSYFYMATQ